MTSTIAKKAPKTLMFTLPFTGQRGGKHEVKMRFKLLGGINEPGSTMISERQAIQAQERVAKREIITRRVEWYRKKEGTNYGRGTFIGYLIYGIKLREATGHPKVKSGWRFPASSWVDKRFWFGD